MNIECANKLLKLLEEPPAFTLCLLVSEEPAALLPTLVSRTQRIHLSPIEEELLADWLRKNTCFPPKMPMKSLTVRKEAC